MMKLRRSRLAALTLALPLLGVAACGGGDGADVAVEPVVASSPTTTTAAPTTTTEAPTTTTTTITTAAPTTTEPDPAADAIAAFTDAFESSDRAGLSLLAPGSPAFVYYEGVVLINETDPIPVTNVTVDGDTITVDQGLTLSEFVFDADGLITDFNRNDVPVSRTVVASGAVFEGDDEGRGIVGTVHSFRYFDGDLQVLVTTVNNSQVEGELRFEDYVSEGRQFSNVFGNSVYPTVTSTVQNAFENVPASGGTLYGHIWADGHGVEEPTLDVPPLG
jgi:hypothetical protein